MCLFFIDFMKKKCQKNESISECRHDTICFCLKIRTIFENILHVPHRKISLFAAVILTLFACENNNFSSQDIDNKDITSSNLNHHSNYLTINNYKSGFYIKITNPWDENKALDEFFVFPDGVEIPQEIRTERIIKSPVRSAVTFSSTQWSVFLQLGEIERVSGILEGRSATVEEVKNLVREGLIADIGVESSFDREKIISLKPDIILYTPYPASNCNDLERLTDALCVPFADYLENTPLGRAEWLKLVGILCGREKEASQWFSGIETRYNALKAKCDTVSRKPTVFSDLPYGGQWYIAGGNSYIARFFKDAGAEYVFSDDGSTASRPIDPESVLLRAKNADFWRITNSSVSEIEQGQLAAQNELFTHFKAFQQNSIIVCDIIRTSYFETAQYRPDEVLADFIAIFHPEILQNHKPKYYHLGLKVKL